MSSQQKADAFQKEAENNGWNVDCSIGAGSDHVVLDCTRDDEHINIFWVENSLTETPKYTIAGVTTSLHNKATATRQLSQKPDLVRAYKRSPRRSVSEEPSSAPEQPAAALTRHGLPFDLWESTDREILKALRGNTIVYFNNLLKNAEVVHIDKRLNMNLNHFNLSQAGEKPWRPDGFLLDPEGGRPIVNFIAMDGYYKSFRSVALESILQVR